MKYFSKKVLLTGAAGFIGMHVSKLLLARGDQVVGIDNMNDYYNPELKFARLSKLKSSGNFEFINADISDKEITSRVFREFEPTHIVNLAAQAGVRYSIENPAAYIQSNLVGFSNILEAARQHEIQHLVYASSSSVYGANRKIPFSENDSVDHPVSLYAATKKSNELMAHSYSHLFSLPTTGLRYFTVYGPWGRPDMAPWLFTEAILEGRAINVYNYGKMKRDFTYIDDIAEGTIAVLDRPPVKSQSVEAGNPANEFNTAYRIYNIGNNEPVELMTFIHTLEKAIGRQAVIKLLPMQAGDVETTFADIHNLTRDTEFRPKTSLSEGIDKWVKWYREYKKIPF